MRVRLLPLLILCPILPCLPAQVALGELAKVARERAERARPAQELALQPFLTDLSLDYRDNRNFLDDRIEQVAKLGDSVVPLLLEKLQPSRGGEASRHLAGNCRRVLERLDPASFVDALAELLQSRSETARFEAIRLLGHAKTPQAERLLTDLVGRSKTTGLRLVLASLRQHATPRAAPKAAPLLGSNDRNVREDVLEYLIASRAGQVADTVVQALTVEKDNRLIPFYIEYCAVAVRAHEGAARALLRLLGEFGERLDWRDKLELVRALATVAPADHDPTTRRLRQLLEAEETSDLAVQAAVTLRALGDNRGVTQLRRLLTEQIRKPQRKREPALYEQRASLLFAIEEYKEASEDYEKVIELSRGSAMTRKAHIGLMRCEAYRGRWTNLTRAIDSSGMTVAEIEALGSGDPRLQEAFEHDKVRNFLKSLARKQAPK